MNVDSHYHADILLNQNINASNFKYACSKGTRQLLGSDYVMLRQEFLTQKITKKHVPQKARKILLTMGGSDPNNATLKSIKAINLLRDPELTIKIIIGPANPNLESLKNEISLSYSSCILFSDIKDMAAHMSWADMAISAGGSTCWELCYLGVPFLIMVLENNQEPIAHGLDKLGAALNVGWESKIDESRLAEKICQLIDDPISRSKMTHSTNSIVDGLGSVRIINAMQETAS